MKRDEEFNNILDECLERLLVKGETIEQCLSSYPEHAAELKPLLQTALAAKKVLAIQPHPEFKARARYQLQSALQEVKPKRWLPFPGWQPWWATAVAVFLALVLAGGGTVAAADSSMPDDSLYPVKLATEQVQLTLTPSDIGKAELYAKLADRRVVEIIYLVNKGKPEQVESTAQRFNNLLVMIANLPLAEKGERRAPAVLAPAPESAERADEGGPGISTQANRRARLRMLLRHYAVNHPRALRAALETAPDPTKPILHQAIKTSVASYEKALETLD